MMLHDSMVETLSSGESSGVFDSVSIDLKNDDEVKDFENSCSTGQETIAWLESKGYHADVVLLFYKRVFIALLSDMLHHIYEGLECSKKAKTSLSFNLLRKPITENLFYLEWLLARPAEFLITFWKEEITEVDFFKKRREQGFIKELIDNVCKHKDYCSLESSELIYDLRYNLDIEQSFGPFCHQATHLITTHKKNYKTSNTNFNFIFSGEKERDAQWEFIYNNLPIILIHTHSVIEGLLKWIGTREAEEYDLTNHRIWEGHLLWRQNSWWHEEDDDISTELKKIFNPSDFDCPTCKEKFACDDGAYFAFYKEGLIGCYKCDVSFDLVDIYHNKVKELRNKKDS